jgi:YbbR domain-containing protein
VVDQADKAVGEIFIRNARETIERMLPVQIQDSNDETINLLEVNPPEIQVTLPIEQRFGYKEVAVSATVTGQAAPGYWVSDISVDPPRITIVGNPRVLSSISGAIKTVPVNVKQATEDIVQVVPLTLPDGVTMVMPEGETLGTTGVKVKVEVSAIESGQTIQRPITQQGIAPHYVWTASPQRADVILSGPIPRLQTLQPSDVTVIVDLFGLEPGVHSVQPTVFLPDDLRVEAILPDTIEVTITLATPTPVPTPTSRPTPAPNTSPR